MSTHKFHKLFLILILTPLVLSTTACDDEDEYDHASVIVDKHGNKFNSATMEPLTDKEANEMMGYYVDEEEPPAGAPVEIFKIGSDLAVENGGKNATVQINNDVYATELWTYHYNGGNGAPGGTIEMRANDGTNYGPWKVEVRNTYYWVATLNQTIPAGTYTVIDSDPGTWSQNGESAGQGMTWMLGIEK